MTPVSRPARHQRDDFIDWPNLRNPVLEYDDWSIKDATVVYHQGTFYLFFSALFEDRGMIRAHVAGVATPDFRSYSAPLITLNGDEAGWIGVCSPCICRVGHQFVLTYNSWGDKPGQPNQLLYATSPDLVQWRTGLSLAGNVTRGTRVIDAAIAEAEDGLYLIYKDAHHQPQIAHAPALDAAWSHVGPAICLPEAQLARSGAHENYQFLRVNGRWRLVCTDFPPHLTWIYTMHGDGKQPAHWLDWRDGYPLAIPREAFNSADHHNAGFVADWREHDGHFYLIYAGNTEVERFARRGHCRLGLARSHNLRHWTVGSGAHDKPHA